MRCLMPLIDSLQPRKWWIYATNMCACINFATGFPVKSSWLMPSISTSISYVNFLLFPFTDILRCLPSIRLNERVEKIEKLRISSKRTTPLNSISRFMDKSFILWSEWSQTIRLSNDFLMRVYRLWCRSCMKYEKDVVRVWAMNARALFAYMHMKNVKVRLKNSDDLLLLFASNRSERAHLSEWKNIFYAVHYTDSLHWSRVHSGVFSQALR